MQSMSDACRKVAEEIVKSEREWRKSVPFLGDADGNTLAVTVESDCGIIAAIIEREIGGEITRLRKMVNLLLESVGHYNAIIKIMGDALESSDDKESEPCTV